MERPGYFYPDWKLNLDQHSLGMMWEPSAPGCDLNRSMQHLFSKHREGDVEYEVQTEEEKFDEAI
jgi:hypothetical protein